MKVMKLLNAIILIIITGIIIAGCGGGNTGYTGGLSYAEPTVIPTVIATATPAPSGGGVFKVTVNIPGYELSKKGSLTADVLPYGSKSLRVTITGEAIDPAIVEETPVPSPAPASVTVTVSDVPVGLNEALIEVLDEGGNVIAHYKHGFYMTAGGTAGPPGVIYLGVVLTEGNYRPKDIDVEPGTELYFENWDSAERTVETTPSLNPPVSPIPGVTPAAQPNTAAVYHSASHTFNTSGIFIYTGGDGGRVLVYGSPSLTSIRDTWNAAGGDNYDNSDSELPLQFTLSGTNFGDNMSSVSGKVEFVNVDTGNILTGSVNTSDWADTEIKGTVTIPASGASPDPGGRGKYLIRVTVRNSNTDSSMVYYLKGTGNYNVTVN